jgi:hypothetical protein
MGAATMVQGVGAALSTTLTGAIIVWGGYASFGLSGLDRPPAALIMAGGTCAVAARP